MAGHYGTEIVTTQNLTVFRVDVERGLRLGERAASHLERRAQQGALRVRKVVGGDAVGQRDHERRWRVARGAEDGRCGEEQEGEDKA